MGFSAFVKSQGAKPKPWKINQNPLYFRTEVQGDFYLFFRAK